MTIYAAEEFCPVRHKKFRSMAKIFRKKTSNPGATECATKKLARKSC
jgi:hypothetical protein